MGLWLKLATALVYILSNYITTVTLVIFLHCFYDTNLRWNKQKAFLLMFFTLRPLWFVLRSPAVHTH